MAVRRVDLEGTPCRLPRHLQILLDETAEDLTDWQGGSDVGAFVPADYVLVFDALCELRTRMPRDGRPVFLEWGSGLGIVTLMASALGWTATGVEVQPALVRESLRLSRVFDLAATFLEGSFFPGDPNAVHRLLERVGAADLIYVYPWPDQEIEIFDLFDRLAKPGAVLLTYFGVEDVRAFRKE
jgi:hypothetical protein